MKLTRFKNKTRKGPNYRHGEQVSFLEIKQTFGLGNIRIGAWVNQEEKALAANLIFDSLADIAYFLALPPKAIGLRGRLNFAFGTGGQRGVQAHYSPLNRELALAKNAGAGALAHEFWHAFDHYISDKAFTNETTSNTTGKIRFASDCWLRNTKPIAHPLNERLIDIFNTTLLSEDHLDRHDYVARSVKADRALSRSYYSQPTEMMARAFESVVESCSGIDNAYLVSGTCKANALPLYPDLTHREQIHQTLLAYFKPLGLALTSL